MRGGGRDTNASDVGKDDVCLQDLVQIFLDSRAPIDDLLSEHAMKLGKRRNRGHDNYFVSVARDLEHVPFLLVFNQCDICVEYNSKWL